MKIKPIVAVCGLSCGLLTPVFAGDAVSGKNVIPTVAESACSTRQIQPLFSRYAQTTKKWTLRAAYSSFKDVELQEVGSFDGSLVDLELTVPLSDRLQLRFYLPLNTDGDAKEFATGDSIDIDGDGGLLDFPSITLDYQFKSVADGASANMAAYFGVGKMINSLDSYNTTTNSYAGKINHSGLNVLFGFKYDRQLSHCLTFVGNLGGRYYIDSDDINPNDGPDKFFLMDASAAIIYAPEGAWVYPVLELVYQGTFSDYNSLQIVPQLIVPIGEHVDLNAGVSIGLLDDGPSTDARVQMTLRF